MIVVTVALIALAGCSTGGLSTPQQPNVPASPTATPGDTPNETGVFPPGASEAGFDNATRLITAHQTALNNTSYTEQATWEQASQVWTENETFQSFAVRHYPVTVEHGDNGTEVRIASENESNRYWFTAAASITNYTSQEYGTTSALYEYSRGHHYLSRTDQYLIQFSSQGIEPYLRDLDYDHVETTTRNNRTLHTYASTGINDTVKPNHGDTPVTSTTENITATVVVTERGIIRSFTATEIHSLQNETVTIEQNYTVEKIDETTTTTPEWATEEIPHVNVSLIQNESVIALTHLGGRSASDPALFFNTPNSSAQTTVNGTIESGDTIYISLVGDTETDPTLQTGLNEQPTVNESFVRHRSGNLSVSAFRSLLGDHDSGVKFEVTIHEASTDAANSTETARES